MADGVGDLLSALNSFAQAAGPAELPQFEHGTNLTQAPAEEFNLPYTPGTLVDAVLGGTPFNLVVDEGMFDGDASGFAHMGHTPAPSAPNTQAPSAPNPHEHGGMLQQDMGTAGTMLPPLPEILDYQHRTNMATMQHQPFQGTAQGNISMCQYVLQQWQMACNGLLSHLANVSTMSHTLNRVLMQGQMGTQPQLMSQFHAGQPGPAEVLMQGQVGAQPQFMSQFHAGQLEMLMQRQMGDQPFFMSQLLAGQTAPSGMAPNGPAGGSHHEEIHHKKRNRSAYATGVQLSAAFKLASKRQTIQNRHKSCARIFTDWMIEEASDSQLSDIWIQCEEDPRIAIDGHWLKKFLMNKTDASKDMASAIIRIMRMNESSRIGCDCHFVDFPWADSEIKDVAGTAERLQLFTEPHPLITPLNMCNKVVATLVLEKKWASLSVDLAKGITNLIAPALSAKTEEEVLAVHQPMCEKLTQAVVNHMLPYIQTKPISEWIYNVPLKHQKKIHPNDTAVCAAYYSLPKSRQFITVSKETIAEARRTHVHSLVKCCSKITGRTVKVQLLRKQANTAAAAAAANKGKEKEAPSDGSMAGSTSAA